MFNFTLIKNTIEKEVRNKSVIFLFALTVVVMYLGSVLSNLLQIEIQESGFSTYLATASMTVVIWIISLSAKFVAALVSANIFRSDLESGVISQILALPINRSSYVINRMLGGALLSFLYLVFILVIGIIILISNDLVPKEVDFSMIKMAASLIPHFLQILIIMFVSCFFSLFFNKIGTLLLTSFYVIASVGVYTYIQAGNPALSGLNLSSIFGLIFYWLLPRIGEISGLADMLSLGAELNIDIVKSFVFGLIHLVTSLAIWGFVFNSIFKRRSF
ncbi:ABC-2 family transporter protein [Bacteriovorax sp. BAL6_X]|uniref:ABC transporter permease n=1 Tax=Bacteriovorax sp. BAL6_X TaxID=1201290 RepID=UPI0003868067|nr:ABC transporter permease [Bacteriovorax sp. BAL6_X]EPZ51332.1 ABC-2 family transporter protein [Bacteriovorax sp. BAL6_X]